MAFYKTKGIVLGSRPFEESAKLVTFFTKDCGKLTIIAKGARRLTSKFGGRLETFSYLDILAAKGRNLDILSQIELLDSFQGIREDHKQLNLGFYIVNVIGAATVYGQKNPELFKLLLLSLKKIAEGVSLDYIVKYFEINLLRAEGLYRTDEPPEDLISSHLDKDIKSWKKSLNFTAS